MKLSQHLPLTIALGAIAYGLMSTCAQATSITIANGSFEAVGAAAPFQTLYAGDNLGGWTITDGSIDLINGYWAADTGNQSIDLSGNSLGAIGQWIVVPHAGTVKINFAMSGNPDDAVKHKTLEVTLTDTQGFSFEAASSTAEVQWDQKTAIFTGVAGGGYFLSFRSTTTDGAPYYGAALDSVSATVPDGGMTASLLGMGIAGVAFLRRKLVA